MTGNSAIEEVSKYCYLGDMLNSESSAERVLNTRVVAACNKWREIAGLLVYKSISLRHRGKGYESAYDRCYYMAVIRGH